MPNYRRLKISGGTFFFTLCLADRRADTLVTHINHFREAYRLMAVRYPFETVALCVLPDHVHMVWALPEGDSDYSTRINQLKGQFTRRLPDDLKAEGRKRERGIWQARYWEHAIRDEAEQAEYVQYTDYNALKHGLVEHPCDWPFSTWRRNNDAGRRAAG